MSDQNDSEKHISKDATEAMENERLEANGKGEADPEHENEKSTIKEEKPEKGKMTFWLTVAVVATVLGSPAQFGYNMGVINAPEATIREFYQMVYRNDTGEQLTDADLNFIWSCTVSVYAVGGMIGSASAGFFANLLGRKKALLCNNAFAAIGGLIMFTARYLGEGSYPVLAALMILGRIVVGINAGVNTIIAPMYVSEIAPVDLRGALGTLFQFGVVLALFFAQILGLPMLLGNDEYWNFLLGLTLVPAAFQLIVLTICPESPRFELINKGDRDSAIAGLKKLRGREDVTKDIKFLEQEHKLESAERKFSVWELLTDFTLREPLVIALTLQVAQQLSGINAVNFYSTTIFKQAELSEKSSRLATVGTGASQLLMIMPTIFLMDKVGRRTLMLFGTGGMCVCSGLVVLFTLLTKTGNQIFMWCNLAAVFGIMGSFSVAPGPVPWLITAELFTQGPRAAAMSLAGATNWIMTFLVGLAFESVLHVLGDYTFLVFMALDYIFWLFIFMKVPETKGRSITSIVQDFRDKAYKNNPDKAAKYEADKKAEGALKIEEGDNAMKSTDA
ncbi:solute carrier family 2, facilitated glucose transporter member 1-like [Convolutriloba macropyga]|uniref:solute carrier family 2, facilitated glucose transporter member 1-like n=1 Tax=Convolutriloba macropyga TaxID=536237 RepID=UPI003F520065